MIKKAIAALAILMAMGTSAASAQYMCSKQGTVFTHLEKVLEGENKGETESTTTVVSVTTADGIETSVEEVVKKINDFAEYKSLISYTYNPATGLTVYNMLSGEEYKKTIINMLVEAARASGNNVTDSDIAELEKGITAKGDLVLDLPAEADPATKIPNKSLKLNMGPSQMSMNLWDAKYAGYETVEVPAGKFENCLKVTYVLKTTSPEATEKKYITEWFAKGIGSIKGTVADKKGKVLEEIVLKSISE